MPETAPLSGYILSFDFGLRRIGVAVGQALTGTATALETVNHGQKPDWNAIDRLVGEWKPALLLVGLPLGADLLVDNASTIARRYGVSDSVIGLTLVALGTSLPELATTVMAALRRQADVALGNVIGSNLFNLLAIIGITTMIGEIPVDAEFLQFDLWVMLAASLLLGPFVFFKMDINRIWGIALTALYLLYVFVVLN